MVVTSAFVFWSVVIVGAAMAQDATRYAGPTDNGFLLPNGWTLKPAGEHIPLPDLPLNIIALADNRHALTSTAGYNAHELVSHRSGCPASRRSSGSQAKLVRPGDEHQGRPNLVVGWRRQRAARVSPR